MKRSNFLSSEKARLDALPRLYHGDWLPAHSQNDFTLVVLKDGGVAMLEEKMRTEGDKSGSKRAIKE